MVIEIYRLSCLLSPFRFFHLLTKNGNRFGKINICSKSFNKLYVEKKDMRHFKETINY